MNVMELVAKITLDASQFKQGVQDAVGEMQKVAPQTTNAFQSVSGVLNDLSAKVAPFSAMAGAIFVPAVKSAVSFEDQIAKVNTLIPKGTASVKELKDMFLDLSNATGRSTADLTEAGYQALSAGVQYDKLSDFVMTATNLSKVGFTETATAVDILTTTMNAYGESAGTADEIANRLVLTQNYGKTTVDELAQSMGRVIPTASGLGVSFDNLATAYVALTKQGINTRISTTYINSLLQELGSTSSNVSQVIQDTTGKTFTQLMQEGMSLGDVIDLLGISSAGLGNKMAELTSGGMEAKDALELLASQGDADAVALMNMFGSSTSASAALALLNYGSEEFNETMGDMADSSGVVNEALEKLNTNGAKIRKMWTQVKNLLIEIGSAFLDVVAPAIEKVGDFVGDLVERFSGLSTPVKQAIALTLGVVTALAPALKIGGLIMNGIGAIGGVITSLSAPVVAIIAVIALFVGALVNLWNTNEEFRNKMISAWQAVQDIVGIVVEFVKARIDEVKVWIDSIMPTIEALWQGIQSFVQNVAEFFANIIELIDAFMNGDLQGVADAVSGIIGNIGGIIMSLVGIVGNLFSLIISAIAGYIGTVISTVLAFGQAVINTIKSFASQMWNAGIEWIQNLVNGILDKVADVYNSIANLVNQAKSKFTEVNWSSVGSDIINGVVNGLSSAGGAIANKMKELASGALDIVKSFLGIGSPSKVFANEVGRWIPAGVSVGVRDAMPQLNRDMEDYMSEIVKPVEARLNFNNLLEMGDSQGGLLNAVYNSIRQGIEDANIRVYMGDREVTRSMKDMGFVYD